MAVDPLCDSYALGPSVRPQPPVIAFRANGLYEQVLVRVKEELAKLRPPVNVDLFVVPKGTPRQGMRDLFPAFVQERGHADLLTYDRTAQLALKEIIPQEARRNLDDIFGSAACSLLLDRFGASFFLFPEECPGATPEERGRDFLAQLRKSLPGLLSLGFRATTTVPDRVVIFTEELSAHVPFCFVEDLGVPPGDLLKESLLHLGIPASRITVVENPYELLFASGEGSDPFLDLLAARSIVFLGDRHVLSPEWVQQGIIGGFSLSPTEQLLLPEDMRNPGRDPSGLGPPDFNDADIEREFVRALSSVLRALGGEKTSPHSRRQVAWLRMPIEHFLVDLVKYGRLDTASALRPEELVPAVQRELLEMIEARRTPQLDERWQQDQAHG